MTLGKGKFVEYKEYKIWVGEDCPNPLEEAKRIYQSGYLKKDDRLMILKDDRK